MSGLAVADKSLMPLGALEETGPWTEVRFTPPTDFAMAELVGCVVALFERHYELRESDGAKVFAAYTGNGNPIHQCALFIRQKVGGRPVPNMDAPAIFEYHQRMITG